MAHRLRTKIVCTIGPSSRDPETLTQLIKAGMDVARLNFSHGDTETHGENIRRIRKAAAALDTPVAILADLQGPKLRVGTMQEGGVPLEAGETLVLTTDPILGIPGRVPVQYEHLPEALSPSDRILVDDGLIELVVTGIEGNTITTRVVTGGILNSNKGMNLPRASLAIPAITEKDKEDLRFALSQEVDWIAQSFVRTAKEVAELKGYIREFSQAGWITPVIVKVEKPEAVDNIDGIIAAADGIMVARGDLGLETSPEAVPMIQKMIILKCNQAGKPVITATQMLDSMIRNPRPTRAEASDVANAVLDGSDAIMLSGETAAGKYPVLAVQTMDRIACQAEKAQLSLTGRPSMAVRSGQGLAEAVAHASVQTATDTHAAAIVASTVSGHTARMISRFRPPSPIVAVTPSPRVQRQLALFWGVFPLLTPRANNMDEVISEAVRAVQEHGLAHEGDILVVTAGTAGSAAGTTNMMKAHLIEKVLARGAGLGERRIEGRVRRMTAPVDPEELVGPDEIVVTGDTDPSFVPVLRRAGGLIAAAGTDESHARSLAIEMGIPAVVGVGEDLGALDEGRQIVLDAQRGLVYERPLPAPGPAG